MKPNFTRTPFDAERGDLEELRVKPFEAAEPLVITMTEQDVEDFIFLTRKLGIKINVENVKKTVGKTFVFVPKQ